MTLNEQTCGGRLLPVYKPRYLDETVPNPFAPGYKPQTLKAESADETILPDQDPHARTIQEFNELFSNIRRFNARFSAASLIHSIFELDRASSVSHLSPQSQLLTAVEISFSHSNILLKTGLSVEPVMGKQIRISVGGEQLPEGQLRVNVTDRVRFVDFLREVQPSETRNNSLGENLQTLSDILKQQIIDHYDLKDPSDKALELLGSLRLIAAEYTRLGLINSLEIYLEHAQKGDLREYLLVDPFLRTSWGPANWHNDASPEELTKRWEEACQALDAAKKNPKAFDLYQQLYDFLQKSIDIAIPDLVGRITNLETPEHCSKLQLVLERVKRILDSY